MKVLVIGAGGREHAIIKKLKQSPKITELFAAPGNGGIAEDAVCVDIKPTDIAGITTFAIKKGIHFTIVTPDDPLVLGMVDALEALGIPCFGPNKAAARIEGSKVFSKQLMKKYNIPTAAYESFDDVTQAKKYAETTCYPLWIKTDGLALGKGAIQATDYTAAVTILDRLMVEKTFGESGTRVVMEEHMTGPEVTVLAFCDGKTIHPMVSSMDYKRAWDGDKGPNTGGMGTIAPNPHYTEAMAQQCMEEIFLPTLQAMEAEGCPFKGCLYFGLMLTPQGPKVVEYNCRFGDPETQVVLSLLETDLFEIMLAINAGTLADMDIQWKPGAAACIVMASGGYPESYETGFVITGIEEATGIVGVYHASTGQADPMIVTKAADTLEIFHAGTRRTEEGALITAGGRVLGVTATGANLNEALKTAYEATERIYFNNVYYRKDIGKTRKGDRR